MAKELKVGVIGVGGIAKTHFPGWNESPHAEIAALADVVPDVLKRVGPRPGVSRLYERPEDLIADPNIDIVDICTPNNYHAPLAIAALDAGKHVICEKPLAPTPEAIRQMIAARDRSGKLLMTAQHFRFQGSAKALKAELDSGVLGNVYHARSWMLRRAAHPRAPDSFRSSTPAAAPASTSASTSSAIQNVSGRRTSNALLNYRSPDSSVKATPPFAIGF